MFSGGSGWFSGELEDLVPLTHQGTDGLIETSIGMHEGVQLFDLHILDALVNVYLLLQEVFLCHQVGQLLLESIQP